MHARDLVYEADPQRYFHAVTFADPRMGRLYATWGHGIPTLLPPCTHVALVTLAPDKSEATLVVIPKDNLALLAARWWHPHDDGSVRLERCPEHEWRELVERAGEYAVERPPAHDEWMLN